jgi:hypothetical protein
MVVRRAIWWAAGCVVASVPIVASIWTANRDAPFYPVLACVAACGGLAAVLHLRRPAAERRRVESIPPSLLFAVAYPLSVAVGIVAEADDISAAAALIVLAAGAAVAAVPVVVRCASGQPARRFRMLMVFWIVVAAPLLLTMAVGVGVLPLAFSSFMSVRSLDRTGA